MDHYQHAKEQLCFAHLTAIEVARAGVNLHIHGGVDDCGVDGIFRFVTVKTRTARVVEKSNLGRLLSDGFDLLASPGNEILYDLEREAYNGLVRRSRVAAKFIVI